MSTPEGAAGGVRWRRFGVMLGLTGTMTAGLLALTASGVLAVNFQISGMPFEVTATHLHGDGFEQYATLDHLIPGSPNAGEEGEERVYVVSAINKATLNNLCQSVFLGGAYLKITAGAGNNPVKAKALVVDSKQIQGNADFDNINVGQDASTLDKVRDPDNGQVIKGGEGVFSQQADTVDIDNLRQENYATTASQFTLPGLKMSFSGDGC